MSTRNEEKFAKQQGIGRAEYYHMTIDEDGWRAPLHDLSYYPLYEDKRLTTFAKKGREAEMWAIARVTPENKTRIAAQFHILLKSDLRNVFCVYVQFTKGGNRGLPLRETGQRTSQIRRWICWDDLLRAAMEAGLLNDDVAEITDYLEEMEYKDMEDAHDARVEKARAEKAAKSSDQ